MFYIKMCFSIPAGITTLSQIMKKFILVILILSGALTGANRVSAAVISSCDTIKSASTADTTAYKTTRLEEVVVNGELQWRDGDKYVFLPQKKQKNIASDANSLLQRMNLPVLQYGKPDEAPSGLDGKPIAIYINGIKATNIDLSTFWPKQCIRVEFYEEPQDPKFNGDRNVVNFIMPVYEWGGLTKVNGQETMPGTSGQYNLSSKFSYKDMTYGMYIGGGYSREHGGGRTATSEYRDLYYDNKYYDLITGIEEASSVSRNDNVAGSFSARYVKGNTNINHQASLNWTHNPGSYSKGTLEYMPDILNGNSMMSRSKSHTLSPVITGQYEFRPRSVNFAVNWQYSHNHNSSWSDYSAGGENPFFNSTRENVNSLSGFLFAGWGFANNRGALVGRLVSNYDWYNTLYAGTYADKIKQRRGNTSLIANVQFLPTEKMRISVSPQLALSYWQLGSAEPTTKLSPGIAADFYLIWNKKNSTSLSVSYFRKDPGASEWNDAMVRQSELWWIKGNPSLDINETYWIYITHRFIQSRTFSLSVTGWWTRDINSTAFRYYAATQEQGGLVKEYFNTSGNQSASFFIDPRLNLFNNNLTIWAQIQSNYSMNFGASGARTFNMHYTGGINYYFGNFETSFYINTKQKWINDDNTYSSYPLQTGFSLSYGNGNIQTSLVVSNFTNKYFTSTKRQHTHFYTYSEHNRRRGCCVSLSLTYTFDYGRKLKDRSTINAVSDTKTSVIGN